MNPPSIRLTPVDFDPFAGPEIAQVYASTEAQREVFAAADWGPEASCAFNESWSLTLEGAFDDAAFAEAARELVLRHEALRSVLSPDGASVVVFQDLPFEVARPRTSVAAHLAKEVETPFDLVRGPLFRMALFAEAPTRHVFVFTAHHVICDGWSAAILVKDLGELYSAAKAKVLPEVEEAARLSDYSAWEAERAKSEDARRDEAYWLGQFQDGVPVLDLPLTKPRPQVKTYASRREDVEIPKALLDALKRIGAKEKASLFTVLIGGFYVWLARMTGQESFVVGVPSAGQSVKGEATLVGHCVNLLPIHAGVPLAQPFTGFLAGLRTKVLDAFDHQQFTYGTLLKKLPIDRDPSRSPLVSVMFNLDQGLSEADLNYAGLKPTFVTTPRHFENFELFLNVIEISGKTTLECQYNCDLFDGRELRVHLEGYVRLLQGVVENPASPVGSLPWVTATERKRLVEDYNRTETGGTKAKSVVSLFEAQALKSARSPAVSGSGKTLTYGELNARANHLAATLGAQGVAPGDLVGIAMDRSPELLVGLLGIMKAGAAYVPIDPSYPAPRLAAMFEDSGLKVLVSSAEAARELPPHEARVVLLDEGRSEVNPPEPAGADALTAYVIFTSGSTGRPKGVAVPQGAVANFLTSMKKIPGMVADDVLLAVTTISFDIHVLELYLPLVTGARLVLATKDEAVDGMRLKEMIREHQISVLQATPATWRMLLEAGWTGKKALKALCGGEPLPGDLAERLLAHVRSLWNMYGPTETTVWSTCFEVLSPRAKILVGRPIDNTTCYVVDHNLDLVPTGVAGELLIGGLGVTKGYVGRDDLTAERFVEDRFSGKGRLYRTGDLARFHPDGQIECLGRTDTQVKLRGFRIELGEIETALARHPSVAQAVAGVRERSPGDPRLVAWFVAAPGATPQTAELRQSLKTSLPEYMIPQIFVPVAALPLTPNGKVDRKRLPSPAETAPSEPQRAKRAPVTRRTLPTGPRPVSPFQERLLEYERRTPGTSLYNLPTGFRLAGALEVPALSKAVDLFAARHEMLRTRFLLKDGRWHQEIVEGSAPSLAVFDLRSKPEVEREEFMKTEFRRLAERPFDLGKAPLFQISLYRLGDAENVLFMMAHHAVWDGWSFDVFVKELSAFYDALAEGRIPESGSAALSYGDFAAWCRDDATQGGMKELESYWRTQLKGAPKPPVLPGAKARPSRPTGKGRSTSYTMSRDLANALTALGKDSGATLFMVLLAAYKALIHRLTGVDDVAVLTPVRGRGEPALEGIVGCFVNQVALRSKPQASARFADFLKSCRKTALEGMSRDELPFDVVADLVDARLAFSFQDARQRVTSFGRLPYKQINVESEACGVDLNFWVKESHENLTGSMNYATDLYDEPTVRGFLEAYDALLHAIVHDPTQSLGALPLALSDEKTALIRSWFDAIDRVERTAAELPGVAKAAAIVLPGGSREARLALHFTVARGAAVTASDLRRYLRDRLGDALTPSVVTVSDDLDKQALTASYHVPEDADGENAAPPATKAERVLAKIWGELLGVPVRNKRANFFEVGGHSLLAIQMLARIEKETGVKVTRMAVTLNTLEQIAQSLGIADDQAPEPARTPEPEVQASTMVPVHFGPENARLFGIYHPPRVRSPRETGVLLCYPGPEEYMRVHWAFRNLTQALLKVGYHVFRFDYFGTGDSAGSAGEGDAATWRSNVAAAAEEFRDMAGIKRLAVVGARLGGALAAGLPRTVLPVDDLVLWDPVVSGKIYVAELETLQKKRLANSRYALERHLTKDRPELLGYPFPPRLARSLTELELVSASLLPAKRTTLITTEAHPDYDRLAARFAGTDFRRVDVDDRCHWRTQELLEQAILPTKVIQAIAQLLAEAP